MVSLTCFNQSFLPLTCDYEEFPHLHLLDCPIELLICSEENVSNLSTSKASGPDGISGMTLKHTASGIGPILMKLFNLLIRTCKVPTAWLRSPSSSPKMELIHLTIVRSLYCQCAPRFLNNILPTFYYLISATYVQYLTINGS